MAGLTEVEPQDVARGGGRALGQFEGPDGFMAEEALVVRNDVLHALPVLHGLHRRRSDDLGYVLNYYDLNSLREATHVMENASRKGNEVLYADGGEAVRRWVESG